MGRFIDSFEVILLDMMGTFMFGGDRFSDGEDYAATYRRLGGVTLSGAQVNPVISKVFGRMSVDYENPALCECFPPASRYIEQVLSEQGLPGSEAELLEAVFAAHESGSVPEECVEAIRRLARTHRLGVVSDIWCRSKPLKEDLARSGVADLFEVVVFSSDYGVNKPSPLLFSRALGHFGVDASRAVFVGDSLRRDVAGAKAAGLATVWINDGGGTVDGSLARPDKVVSHLRELL